jgi:hypothetical protein
VVVIACSVEVCLLLVVIGVAGSPVRLAVLPVDRVDADTDELGIAVVEVPPPPGELAELDGDTGVKSAEESCGSPCP